MIRKLVYWSPWDLWNRTRLGLHRTLHPDSAWFPRSAMGVLSKMLKSHHVGLEWGSGKSTLWLAKRIKHLTSVEDDPARYDAVAKDLLIENLTNVDYILCRQARGACDSEGCGYVNVIGSFPPASLDLVLVKGRYRDLCATAALDKIKPGGLLILQDANHHMPSDSSAPGSLPPDGGIASKAWAEFQSSVFEWWYFWASNGCKDAAIWMKPDPERR